MSMTQRLQAALSFAQERMAGHADAAHWGEVDADCADCVRLAAACGVDLSRRS